MSDLSAEAEPGATDVAVEKRAAAVAGAVQPRARAPGAAVAGAGAGASAQRVPSAGSPLLCHAGHGRSATNWAYGTCTLHTNIDMHKCKTTQSDMSMWKYASLPNASDVDVCFMNYGHFWPCGFLILTFLKYSFHIFSIVFSIRIFKKMLCFSETTFIACILCILNIHN